MLPNPLSATVAGPDDASRAQLRLASRTDSHPDRDKTTIAETIQEVVHRSHGQWRGTLVAVRETLATLERSCESAIEVQEAGVAALIETLVGNASAEADAAAQQTRAQAQIEIAELQRALAALQTVVETLQTDLGTERDRVTSLKAQLDAEVAARVRTEAERDEARRQCQLQVAAAESRVAAVRSEIDGQSAELSLARQQLDAAIAERSKLAATFQLIQRAVALGTNENIAIPAPGGERDATSLPESDVRQSRAGDSSAPEAPGLASGSVASEPPAFTDTHPEVVEDVKRVLAEVEAMYQMDLNSGRSGMEVVDSLTASIRYARGQIVARWTLDDCDVQTLFESEVDGLLNVHAGTMFGRHLSIAAYASRQMATPPEKKVLGTEQEKSS